MLDGFILWIPTILFILFIIIGFLIGLWRGFRKSLVLAIQAVIAFTICFVFYLIIVNNSYTDYTVVSMINKIMGADFLQTTLGVSPEAKSLKEILVEYIPKNLNYGDGFALVIKDNGAYLGSLVNLIYHILFAIVFMWIYSLLLFIFYIVYFFAYPERRYKAKIKKNASINASDKTYKKRRLLGALVGSSRGFVSGFICMSFLGTLLFVFTGGVESSVDSIDSGDKNIDDTYSIYNSFSNYGSTGIFKIMNAIKDENDIPYYVYVADLVFQGEYKDPETGLESNIVLSRELSSYTIFARKTFDLVLKYDDENLIKKIVLGTENLNIMDEVIKIISKEEFQEEFSVIIDEFNAGTYFINLSLSLVDSIVKYIDDLSFKLSDDVKEPIKIMFKQGYQSPYIPEDSSNKNPACINVSSLLNQADAKYLLKTVISVLSIEKNDNNLKNILSYSERIIPALSGLSILSDNRKEEMNPVFSRMYSYLANKYLNSIGSTNDETQEINISYMSNIVENKNQSVDWVKEINSLLDISLNAVKLTSNIDFDSISENTTEGVIDLIFDIFDTKSDGYSNNIIMYNNIKNDLANSSLLSLVLSDTNAYKYIEKSLVSIVPQIYLSEDISYVNEIDSNGNVIKYGEVYNLLNTIQCIAENENSKNVLNMIMNMNDSESNDTLGTIKSISNLLNSYDNNNKQIIDYFFDSEIISSVLSGFVFSYQNIDTGSIIINIYVPNNSILTDSNGQKVNLINKDDLKGLFAEVPELFDCVVPYLDANDSENYNNIDKLIDRLTFDNGDGSLINNIIKSDIIEGTLVNIVCDIVSKEDLKKYFVIPKSLKNEDDTINVEKWLEKEELAKMIDAVVSLDISFGDISNIANTILTLNEPISSNETKLDVIYKSDVIKGSIANILVNVTNESPVIIPNDVYIDDGTDRYIEKNEIKYLVDSVNSLGIDLANPQFTYINLNDMVRDSICESQIILSTFTNILEGENLKDVLVVPYLAKNNDYISEKELYNLMTILISNKEKLFSDFSEDGKVKLDSLDVNNLTVNVLNDIVDRPDNEQSIILNATIIVQIGKKSTEFGLVIPTDYVECTTTDLTNVNESIITKYNENLWVINDEIQKLLTVLNIMLNEDKKNDTLTTISVDSLTENLEQLNEAYDENFSKLDKCYESVIMRATMSNYLDETMIQFEVDEALTNSNIIKEYDLNYNDNSEYYFYKKEEISGLVYAVNYLSLDLDNADLDVIKNNITNLNDFVDESTTKLDKVYKSNIVKYLICNELEKILGADIAAGTEAKVEDDVRGTVKELLIGDCYSYKITEIRALIDSANILELNVDFDVSSVQSKILTLNELVDGNSSQTKLDVLYNSVLIKRIITKEMDKAFETLIPADVRSLTKTSFVGTSYDYYNQNEVANIIYSADELGITDINIDVEIIKSNALSLNSASNHNASLTKLGVIYSSVNMKYLLSNELDKALNGNPAESIDIIVEDDVRGTVKELLIGDYYSYSIAEVKSLIDSANILGLGFDFNLDVVQSKILTLNELVDENSSQTKLDVLYNSVLIKRMIAKEIDRVVIGEADGDVLTKSYDIIVKTYNSYKKDVVSNLINAVKNGLKIDDINNLTSSFNNINDIDFDALYSSNSYITLNVLSKKIFGIIDSNDNIINHKNAFTTYLDFSSDDIFYKKDELVALQTIVSDSISDFSLNNIDLSNSELLSKSSIFNATITNKLSTTSNFILPENNYDNKLIIDNSEFKALIDAVSSLFGNNLSNPDISSIMPSSISDIDMISNSVIMRANISNMIKSSGKENLYMTTNCIDNKLKYYSSSSGGFVSSGKYQYIIAKEEINNIIDSFKILSPDSFDANIDINVLVNLLTINENGIEKKDTKNLNMVLESEFMRILVSEYLINDFSITVSGSNLNLNYASFKTSVSSVKYVLNGEYVNHIPNDSSFLDVYDLSNKDSNTSSLSISVLAKEDILAFVWYCYTKSSS